MKAALYGEVHRLSINIVNASEKNQQDLASEAYVELKALCDSHQESDSNHPLQWEALGDFSECPESALAAYQSGLKCAEALALVDYKASILFAMAECHLELGNIDEAAKLALWAQQEAKSTVNDELKSAIDGFLES